jgi:hypothetical protein
MEKKKSNMLAIENKKLKVQQKESQSQLNECMLVLEEKDGIILDYEEKIKSLEMDLQKKSHMSRQKNDLLSRKKSLFGNNPLLHANMHIAKQKSMQMELSNNRWGASKEDSNIIGVNLDNTNPN